MDNKRKIVFAFLAIPFISSAISMVHIVSFFDLGNPMWMSYSLAIAFEIGSLASLVSFTIIDKLNKTPIYLIFVVLFLMQIIGNVYFSYNYVSRKLIEDPNWLTTFREFIDNTLTIFGGTPGSPYTKYILSCVIGIPIPLISISFIKSLVDYLTKNNEEIKKEPVVVDIKETKENDTSDTKSNALVVETVEKKEIKEDTPEKAEDIPENHGLKVTI